MWAYVLVAVTVAVVGAVGVAVKHPAPAFTPGAPIAEPVDTSAIRLAAIGDSVTQGDSPDFSKGRVGSLSWVKYATAGNGVRFAGGWAVHGATSGMMLQQATPLASDVLVVLLGTNDTGQDVPFSESASNIEAIAAKVGAPRVIISTIPPRNADPGIVPTYNQQLQQLAAAQHWEFVDAMAGVRSGDQYAAGMTVDGIHPTRQAAQIIGAALRKQILAVPAASSAGASSSG